MTAYLKEIQSKKETSQMGLFDGLDSTDHAGVHFELVTIDPTTQKKITEMTFEERMK